MELFEGDELAHESLITQLRALLSEDINHELSNHDCLRFLRARNGNIERAEEMIVRWYEWRHNLMDPLPPHGVRFSPNVLLASPITLDQHPSKHLLPVTHQGFSRSGHPIYWEKTGYIQSTFAEVKKHFTNVELLQYHIMSNELCEARFQFATKKFHRPVNKMIVVFDMSHVQITLDMDSIWYIKQILQVDQNYYPERLYKLYIINSPWYFPALYGMFKPFIDQRTRDKINIFSSDFLAQMQEVIDLSEIPVEYGGTKEVRWDMIWDDDTGASRNQAEEFFYQRLSTVLRGKLTFEELAALKQGLVGSGKIDQAIRLLEEIVTSAESNDNDEMSTAAIRDEIERLRSEAQIPIKKSSLSDFRAREESKTMTEEPLPTREINIEDEEVMSFTSTPTVSTVQMSHLSDVLSVQINDVEVTAHSPDLFKNPSQKRSGYHCYVVTVHCRRNKTWKIQRRYSQFYKFRKFLSRINPKVSSLPFPPKKYFFNTSTSVVAYRKKNLQNFVNQILRLCEGFDTPEHEVIFRFLDGYEHIENSLRDTLSVGIWTDVPSQQSTSLPHLDDSSDQGALRSLFGFSSHRPSSLSLTDQRIWRTPLAAAVLSCCLLVISIISQVQSSAGQTIAME